MEWVIYKQYKFNLPRSGGLEGQDEDTRLGLGDGLFFTDSSWCSQIAERQTLSWGRGMFPQVSYNGTESLHKGSTLKMT